MSGNIKDINVAFDKVVTFKVADSPMADVCFALSVRKSGSSIFNNIVAALANMNGVTFVDVAGKLFEHGVSVAQWQRSIELLKIVQPGNVYGGFRNMPFAMIESPYFKQSRKLLMVRDPRDALVSEYFSNAYSHSLPTSGSARDQMIALRESALQTNMESYIIRRAKDLKETLAEYAQVLKTYPMTIIKYEDFILDKKALIAKICDTFKWQVSSLQVSQILGWADVVPDEERPMQFIRRVTPGDHREKLSQKTIRILDEQLSEEMTALGYNV